MKYDVVIIGAGVAGVACALTLKELGLTCAIFHKARGTKACGGGITDKSIALLNLLGIDSSTFFDNDAKVIRQSIQLFQNGDYRTTDYTNRTKVGYSLGISREIFDAILIKKAIEKNIPIFNIQNNVNVKTGIRNFVNGVECKNIVYATGAAGENKDIYKSYKKTFGISKEVSAELNISDDSFYFFMEDNNSCGDYGWVFPIGTNKWSIGVWKKEASLVTKEVFNHFYNEVFLPKVIKIYSEGSIKGGFINCGDDSYYKSSKYIYYIGDCAGTSSFANGEGIYQALKSGIEAAKDIAKIHKS